MTISFALSCAGTAPVQDGPVELRAAIRSVSSSIAAQLPPGHRIAIDDVKLDGTRKSRIGDYIASLLIKELGGDNRLIVVERKELERALAESQFTLNQISQEPARFKQIGQFLPAEALVSGSLVILKDSIDLSLRVFSTSTGEIIATAGARIRIDDDLNDMLPLIR